MPASHTAVIASLPCRKQARSSWPERLAAILRAPLTIYAAYAALAALAMLTLWPTAWLGRQMLSHVVTMAVVAPLAVGLLRWSWCNGWRTHARHLWMAAVLQMAVFLFWHAPFGMIFAMNAFGGALLLQVSLLVTACVFWGCIAGLGRERLWHAIAALLFTGKVFCLVAVILTFAPRPLYHMMTLADQQLAGLIMITLCPLVYVASALWLCWRWLMGFDRDVFMQPGCAPCE
jgi:putative membrane protein